MRTTSRGCWLRLIPQPRPASMGEQREPTQDELIPSPSLGSSVVRHRTGQPHRVWDLAMRRLLAGSPRPRVLARSYGFGASLPAACGAEHPADEHSRGANRSVAAGPAAGCLRQDQRRPRWSSPNARQMAAHGSGAGRVAMMARQIMSDAQRLLIPEAPAATADEIDATMRDLKDPGVNLPGTTGTAIDEANRRLAKLNSGIERLRTDVRLPGVSRGSSARDSWIPRGLPSFDRSSPIRASGGRFGRPGSAE